MDRPQSSMVAIKQALQCLAQILQEVKAIGDLHRLRCPFRCSIGIRSCTVAADDGDLGVLLEPSFDGCGGSIRQQVDHLMGFKIDDHRPLAVPFAPGPVVDANDLWGRRCRCGRAARQAKERVRTGGHAGACGSAGASFAAMLKGEMALIIGEAEGPLS
jgi:hypothetical protein